MGTTATTGPLSWTWLATGFVVCLACGSTGDHAGVVEAGAVDATDAEFVPALPENPLDATAGSPPSCPLACPPHAPPNDAPCGIPGQVCQFGTDLRRECRETHRCIAGRWMTVDLPTACASPEPVLPCPANEPNEGEACSFGGLRCRFGSEDCTCGQSTAKWRCGRHDLWCGDREPNPGQPCADGTLCAYFEGYPCQVVWQCGCGVWDVHVTTCE